MMEVKTPLKLRYPHWWFGRYIQWMGSRWVDEAGRTFPKSQVCESEMQVYLEHKHGVRSEEKRRYHPDQFTHKERQAMVYLLSTGHSMWDVATRFKTSEKAIRVILRDLGQQLIRVQGGKDGCEATDSSSVGP